MFHGVACCTGEGINIDESNELFSLAALKGRGNLADQAERRGSRSLNHSVACCAGGGISIDESNELFSLAALKGRGNLADQAEVPSITV